MTALVLHDRKVGRSGLDAVLGAVERDPRAAGLPATCAFGLPAALAAARAALQAGRRPVVGWSGPGEVDEETRLLLERLASAGQAYGPWRPQKTLVEIQQ